VDLSRVIGITIGFGLLLVTRVAYAQAPDVGYYQHDYARTPLAEKSDARQLPRGRLALPTPTPDDSAAAPDPAPEHEGEATASTPSPTPTPQESPVEETAGIPISEVKVFVNAIERSHFLDVVAEYGSIAAKYNLTSSGLIAVGGFFGRDDVPPEMTRLLLLGTPVAPFGLVPPKYKVERSPTWVLTTEKGEIVIEGFMSIDKFLNRKGEFQRKFLEIEDPHEQPEEQESPPMAAPPQQAPGTVRASVRADAIRAAAKR